jgi:hypothetical protein
MGFFTKNLSYTQIKTIHVNSSYRKNKRFFCEKAHERLFLALFSVHTGKKKRFREKG